MPRDMLEDLPLMTMRRSLLINRMEFVGIRELCLSPYARDPALVPLRRQVPGWTVVEWTESVEK